MSEKSIYVGFYTYVTGFERDPKDFLWERRKKEHTKLMEAIA